MTLYKLIGADGREYGPANADQVRHWIREHRVERQTRIFVLETTNWTTAGLLPEFANEFSSGGLAGAPPLIHTAQPQFLVPAYTVPSNSMAKAGLICGILAVTVGCCCAGMPFNFLGLVFSIMALVQCSDNPQQYGGRGMAIVGLVLSAFSFFVLGLAVIFR